jgi:hypothetical protein
MRYKVTILAAIIAMAGAKVEARDGIGSGDIFEKLSCRDLIDAGWKNMPDVADYVLAKPGLDKLGFGSECHIGSLVFSQCWLEPRWSVKKAIDVLIHKAVTGKRLPETPVCGA